MKKYYISFLTARRERRIVIISFLVFEVLMLTVAVALCMKRPFGTLFGAAAIAFLLWLLYDNARSFWLYYFTVDENGNIIYRLDGKSEQSIPLSNVCRLEETQNRDFRCGAVCGKSSKVYAVVDRGGGTVFYVYRDREVLDFFRSHGIEIAK